MFIRWLLGLSIALGCLSSVWADSNPTSSALQQACSANKCEVSRVTRAPLAGGLAHYSAQLRVGADARDLIRIHRVVKEVRPWVPRSTPKSLFMVHPEPLNFDAAFFNGHSGDKESSIAVFMAQRGLDVWAIDLRATQVPPDTTDFAFMADWDLETDVRDTQIAMTVARAVRVLTGSGASKLKLFGYARGGQIGYVLLQREAQQPAPLRSVDGFIPMETLMKTQDAYLRTVACDLAAQNQALFDAGIYTTDFGAVAQAAGVLALTEPNGPSPFAAGLTNEQVGLTFGGATFVFGEAYTPTFHLVGADFNEVGPVAFRYTDQTAFFTTMSLASPFGAPAAVVQGDLVVCQDTPLDDHLDDIIVPILYVGAAGGLGALGEYTLTLLGSTDVSSVEISLVPPEQNLFDFGHDDVLRSSLAPQLVWTPMLNWVLAH